MEGFVQHDAYARPPNLLKDTFKYWQKSSINEIDSTSNIIDLNEARLSTEIFESRNHANSFACSDLLSTENGDGDQSNQDLQINKNDSVFELKAIPGLFIFPTLLSSHLQVSLLNKLFHRDLSCPNHKTNLHLHYNMQYQSQNEMPSNYASFFATDPNTILHPKDPSIHKPLTVNQMLQRKLRWMTLGGQYDWTMKQYPKEEPPSFPSDIGHLLKCLFPDVDAQAAIVNLYSPGDTLSLHRDVSEECNRGLISISIGCDGLFLIGNHDGSKKATIRLRSGDAILMTGESRFAWHAVPKIIPDTCPKWLEDWPVAFCDQNVHHWKGWMQSKRINLNVRQMRLVES